jgi:hypothetical protein
MSIGNLFRAFVCLIMATWVFGMYSTARTMSDVVGFEAGTVIGSAVFALVMLIPLTPAAGVPDLPELITRARGIRRWRQKRCPDCGYELAGLGTAGTCPECASELIEPASLEFGPRTLRRFAVISLMAWLCGTIVAETWIWNDERAFAAEVRQLVDNGRDAHYSRARRWPSGNSSLVYVPGQGVHGTCH